jgi:hypothetical protein
MVEGSTVAKRLLRREHIVAASLVGSVVVVIGFASGLGTRPGTGASAAPAPGGEAGPPVATAPPQTTQTQPRQGGGGSGGGGGGGSANYPGGGGAVLPVTTMPTVPPSHGHPTTPTTPPPTGTTPPPTTCDPGLVPVALDTLLGTLGQATDALGLPVPDAVGLLGATSATAPVVPGLSGTGIPAVDQFIATCQAPTTAPTTTAPTTTMPGHGG